MTARRSLALLASLALGPIPACLHISGSVTPPPPEPPPPKRDFASLPSRPGEVVRANPVAPVPADLPATVSRRPAPEADVVPEPPDDPPVPVAAVRAEAKPLPLPTLTPQTAGAVEPPLVAALRAYVENRPYDALRHLDGLDRANQELAIQLLPQFARLAHLNLGAADAPEAGVMADQLRAAADRLAARGPLRVEKLVFCRSPVDGFGRYTPRPVDAPFGPGDRTHLYLEVDHVAGEAVPGPRGEGYLTRLQVTLSVRDSAGREVLQADPKDARRLVRAVTFDHAVPTRAPVRDYHRTYSLGVPPQAGVYYLTAEVRELTTGRTAKSPPVEFRVAAP